MQGEKEPQLAGLIRRVQLGDAEAFSDLVQEYSRHVYQTAYTLEQQKTRTNLAGFVGVASRAQ